MKLKSSNCYLLLTDCCIVGNFHNLARPKAAAEPVEFEAKATILAQCDSKISLDSAGQSSYVSAHLLSVRGSI